MTKLTRSTQIYVNTNLQKAFDYVSDLTKHSEWSDGELKIEAVSSEPVGVGKEYVSRGQVLNQKNRPNTLKVTNYEPPYKFSFVANDHDFGDVSHVFTFVEQDGGVLITRTMNLTLNPFIAFGFTLFVYPLIGRPSMQKAFEKLKTKLESER